jgi:hypothetical protein
MGQDEGNALAAVAGVLAGFTDRRSRNGRGRRYRRGVPRCRRRCRGWTATALNWLLSQLTLRVVTLLGWWPSRACVFLARLSIASEEAVGESIAAGSAWSQVWLSFGNKASQNSLLQHSCHGDQHMIYRKSVSDTTQVLVKYQIFFGGAIGEITEKCP